MRLVYDNSLKITTSWGRNDTSDSRKSKFHMVNFSGGLNEYIFGCWVGFAPIFRVYHKCFGAQWGIILGDNPAGHCFVLRDLVPLSFFK